MAENVGYNLGTGFLHATVSFDGIGNDIAKHMRKVSPKAGVEAGKRIGKGMREGVEKESAKVDLASYEAHVTNVEKRIAKQSAESAEKQEAARRKVEIATAKLNEAREKYKEGSSQILAAEDKLAEAQGRLTRETKSATDAQDKLNNELSDAKKSLGDAKDAAEKAADAYKQSFGKRFARRIGESIREAVSPASAAVVAGASGAVSGIAWGQGFKRGLGGQNVGGFIASTLAGMSGARVLGDIGGGFRDFITNLDRSVPRIGAVTVGLMSLGGAGIAAVGGLLGVVNSLGSIAAVGLTLPGLIGAGAASMAVFTMAAMDAVAVLGDLGPGLSALQDSVSDAFWNRAADPIRDLANFLLPALQHRMSEVAHEMGGIAVAVTEGLRTPDSLYALNKMFVYLRDSIDVAGDGVGALTEAVMQLGLVGASYLPDLAGWFNRIAWELQAWVDASIASGDIFRWIDTGLENLRALGGVIWHTIGIFHALGEAASAAGAGGLVGLAEGLERANRALHSDVWQAGLVSMFSGARKAMAAIGDGFGDFARGLLDAGGVLREGMILSGESVGMILSALGDLFRSPAVQGGLAVFFLGINEAVEALTGNVGPLGAVLGGLLGTMGTVAATLGNVVANAVDAFGPAVVSLIEGVRPLIPMFGQIVNQVVDFLAPAVTVLANGIQNGLLPAVTWLADKLINVPGLLEGIVVVLGGVGAAMGVAAVATVAHNVAMGAAAIYVKAYRGVAILAAGAAKVMAAGQWLLNAALTANPIGLVVAGLAALVAGVVLAYSNIGWFKDAVDAAWAGIKVAFQATIAWITDVAWPALLNGLQWVGDKFVWLWENVVRPVWGWIKGAVSAVVDWFTNTAWPAFKSALDWLGKAFDFLYRNFVGPVMFLVRFAIEKVATWFTNTVVPAFRGALDVLGAAFSWLNTHVVQPVWSAIQFVINAVMSWFRNSLVPTFRRALSVLGDAFTWFNNRVVQPVWTWIQDKITSVVRWFAEVLVPWFRRGIQSVVDKFTNLRDWVRSVWDRVGQILRSGWEWIDTHVFGKFRAGLTLLQDAFTRTKDGIADAWDKLKAKVKEPIAFVVNKVINPFITGYNAINNAWSGTDIGKIPGFRKGGYTGKLGKDEVAGHVHGDEHVIRSESRRSIENTSPGLLDAMNKYGASALKQYAPGDSLPSYGGVRGFDFPLQDTVNATRRLAVLGSAPGWDLPGAVRMMDNATAIRVFRAGNNFGGQDAVRVGFGQMPANVAGYYSGRNIRLNPGAMSGASVAGRRTVVAHEIGHALGLPHSHRGAGGNGVRSIMNYDTMFRDNAVMPADVSALARIFGGGGKAGGGGGGSDEDTSRLGDMMRKLISGPFGELTGKAKGNVFGGMAKGLAENVVDGIIKRAKELFSGSGKTLDDVNDMLPGGGKLFAGGQKWDDPVGTVHKLSPGVSSIYNGTGGDEHFQRVDPSSNGGPLVQNLYAFDADEAMRKLHNYTRKQEMMHAGI